MTDKKRLSRNDWIEAGFRALANDGPSALKAEALARTLRSTKGSFYWHFPDVDHFHKEMLDVWEARAFTDIVTALEVEPDPRRRLRALGKLAAEAPPEALGGRAIEPSIRAWSRAHPGVADAVARVDGKREAYVRGLLSAVGLSNPDFARMIYAAYVGAEDLSTRDGTDPAPALGTLIDLVLTFE